MKTLTPMELSIIKFVEFVVFLAISAAVTVALPLINTTTGTINWTNVAFSSLAVFLLVIIFVVIEYLKQSIQVKLLAAEKSGQSTVELQDQLAVITAVEASIGQIVEHTKTLSTLVPNIATLITTAQQTATSALQQAQNAPTTTNTPVSTYAYAVDEVSSSTGSVPAVAVSGNTSVTSPTN